MDPLFLQARKEMTSKLANLRVSMICAMGLGMSAIVPPAGAAAAGPYQAEATLATAVQSATDKDVRGWAEAWLRSSGWVSPGTSSRSAW